MAKTSSVSPTRCKFKATALNLQNLSYYILALKRTLLVVESTTMIHEELTDEAGTKGEASVSLQRQTSPTSAIKFRLAFKWEAIRSSRSVCSVKSR